MKKVLVLATLLLVIPLLASARGQNGHSNGHQHNHGQPTPPVVVPKPTPVPVTPITPPPSTQGLCVNYGHQPLVNGQYDMTQVTGDFANLKAHNITCVRTADYGTNSSLSEGLALYAKQQGFYVQIGNDAGQISSGDFGAYDAGVLAEAKWAQSNGIPEVSLGNEQEYRLQGMSIDSWIAHVKALATQIKTVYKGKISYDTSGDFENQWVAAGSLGSLDALGLNLYCGSGCNSNYLTSAINAWGVAHVEVTETDCDIGSVSSCQTDAGLAAEVKGDALHLVTMGVPVYFFAYRSGGDGTSAYWGVTQHPLTMAALGL